MKKSVILLIILILITSCNANNNNENSNSGSYQNSDAADINTPESPEAPVKKEEALITKYIESKLSDDYLESLLAEARLLLHLPMEGYEETLVYVRNICEVDEEWFGRIIKADADTRLAELEAASLEDAMVKLLQVANAFVMESDYDQYKLMAFEDCSQGYRALQDAMLKSLPKWAVASLKIEIDLLSFPQE